MAGLLTAMGECGAVRPLYERVLAIYEAALGPDHPTTQLIRGNLAALRQDG